FFFLALLEGYCWTRTSARQAAKIRASYLGAVLRQEVSYFDLHVTSPSEIITTVSNDCLAIQDVISEKLPFFLMNLAMFLGCFIIGLILQWRLAIVGLPFVILLVVPGILYGRTLMVLARGIAEEYKKAGNITEQAISSIRTVYAFVGETKTNVAYSTTLEFSVVLGLKQGLAKGLAFGSNGVVFAIWSFMVYYGSRMVMYHGSKGGTVFSVSTLVVVGGLALGSSLSNLKYFSEAWSAGERMTEIIRRVSKIDIDNTEGGSLENVKGEVEFRHVEFAYPSRPDNIVFKDFSLHIPSAKTVALVGSSGSGKSTLIALLQRFYDPLRGEILLDNVAIDKLQLKWLRSQMGLVSQEPILFATSIKENILFGKEDGSVKEIVQAAKSSNAHNFISQFPQGYDTQVGERGVQMSGDRMSLLVQTLSSVIVAWTMGLMIAPKLAIIMIAVQPIFIICFYTRHILIKSMSQRAVKAHNETSKLAAEAVSNLRTITAFSSQARILSMLDKAQESPRREFIKQSWYAGLGLSTSQCLMLLTTALDLWYGGKLVSQREISVKAVFETFLILINTGPVIANAGAMITDLAKGSETIRSVFDTLDRQTRIEPEDPKGYKPERIMGLIEFQDVDFAYPTRPNMIVFQGFTMKIEAGKSTALVGQSGSGKSTIISLIERFYDPQRGTVRIDGRDVRTYNLRSLRKQIGLVSQEPVLFAATIKDNITYGSVQDEIGESEVIAAAKAAKAHDFISGLNDGYDTWCGDKGIQLSGGQKQRIAMARAVLRNPKILLLDEATSALDGWSEKAVQAAVERVMVGRTIVVVAHRLSTIQNCDSIVVLEKGVVIESGTHSSLLAKGPAGAYYSLVNLQRISVDVA
ncbi:unnamed protein product, partial [Linum tenue]